MKIYGLPHLGGLLIERCEVLPYFDLEVSGHLAQKVDIDLFRRPAGKTYLAYTLGVFMSSLTSWGETSNSVDWRCVSFTHLLDLEQRIPCKAALEAVHVGMNAEHIRRVLRAPCTLHVIPPTVVLE